MASSEVNSGWSKTLHNLRGTGSGLRIRLNSDKLEKHGWSVVSRDIGNKRLLTFIDPEGCRHKSAREVERKLDSEGTLHRFLKDETTSKMTEETGIVTVKPTDKHSDDPYYEPPLKQRTRLDEVKNE